MSEIVTKTLEQMQDDLAAIISGVKEESRKEGIMMVIQVLRETMKAVDSNVIYPSWLDNMEKEMNSW